MCFPVFRCLKANGLKFLVQQLRLADSDACYVRLTFDARKRPGGEKELEELKFNYCNARHRWPTITYFDARSLVLS